MVDHAHCPYSERLVYFIHMRKHVSKITRTQLYREKIAHRGIQGPFWRERSLRTAQYFDRFRSWTKGLNVAFTCV